MITERLQGGTQTQDSEIEELMRPGAWTPAPPEAGRPRLRFLFLLPLLLCAFVGAYFLYQARYDEQFRYYPYAWQGHWIEAPHAKSSQHMAYFRKTFTVTGPVQSAYIAIAAENEFNLDVNGRGVPPFYVYPENEPTLTGQMAQFSHEGVEPTNYAAFGNLRRGQLGHVYMITKFLRPGRNVISIAIMSDEGAPRLAVQAVLRSGGRQEIVSDGSWKTSPTAPAVRDMNAQMSDYPDANWSYAHDTGDPITVPVDGETQSLEAPLNGWFIGANGVNASYPVRLRRTIVCPAAVKTGWMRVSSSVPYTLRLNGAYAGSSALQDHYRHDFVQRQRDEYETLGRVRGEDAENNPPPLDAAIHMDTYMMKNVLRAGANTVEIVLNKPLLQGTTALPIVYLDGHMAFPDGTAQSLATDFSWQVNSGAGWGAARIASKPDSTYSGFYSPAMADLVTPGYHADLRILRNGVLLVGLLLVAGWIGAGLVALVEDGGAAQGVTLSRIGVFCAVPAIFLSCAALLQAVFAYSMQDQYFSTTAYATLVLNVAVGLWLLTVLTALFAAWRGRGRVRQQTLVTSKGSFAHWADRYGFALAVGVVMCVAAVFYTYQIARQSIIPDEYVSLLAAQGILRHGVPVFEFSNIIYTRSGLYHYLLAGCLALTNYLHVDMSYTRLLAAGWQLALIPVAYLFGRELKGRWVGLIAAMLVALSPYQIYLARETRFYTEFAFFATLTCYFLYKSLREPNNDKLKGAVAMAFVGAYMSQELSVSMLPAMVLMYLLGGQLMQWVKLKNLAWIGVILLFIGADFVLYSKYCATDLPFIDNDSSPLMALHTSGMDSMSTMLFINIERTQLVQGVLYFIGMAYALVRLFQKRAPAGPERAAGTIGPDGWRWWNFLYLMTGITVLVVTVIAAHAAGRYTVHMAPLLALTAACVAVQLGQILYGWVRGLFAGATMARLVTATFVLCLGFVALAACRPERTWNAMSRINNREDTMALRYVAAHIQPGDKIIAFNSESSIMELGRSDFHWRPWKQSRAKYFSKDGVLRERNSAAPVVDNADKLRQILTQNPRVWMIVPPHTLSGGGAPNPTYMRSLLMDNMQVVYEQYNVEVLFWDKSENHFRNSAHDSRGEMANFN